MLSTWRDDRWARAAYSIPPSEEITEVLSEPLGQLAFAGEHLGGQFAGLMEGALAADGQRPRVTLILVPDTGFPSQDAQSDFARARRREVLARLAKRLRREPADVHMVLPFEEVRDALGFRGERHLGLQVIPLDSIVGTVDRTREFDRRFRPTSRRVRDRWQRVAEAQRRGESMPPISVYRIGDMHFVEDGHHRVSVARAQDAGTSTHT